jgi:hypothetical protein
MRYLIGLIWVVLVASCQHTPSSQNFEYNTIPEIAQMEKAHQVSSYYQKEAVSFQIKLEFGGKPRLDAEIAVVPGSSKIRMKTADGVQLVWDGSTVWMSPKEADYPSARFDIFTWQYFFEVPYKLSDPGTMWEIQQDRPLYGELHHTAKLSFKPGTGDSHKDWYLVYADPEQHLIRAMSYIVTFKKTIEEASEEPHAITYEDYREIDGIPIAHNWKFWMWTDSAGIYDPLGEATISRVQFFDPEPDYFQLPEENRVEVPYVK